MAAIILCYAGLLARARWGGDEYLAFALMRDDGWSFYGQWFTSWSPRLWSDILYAAYGAVVNTLHRPLAGSCLAVLWAALAASCILPGLRQSRDRRLRVMTGLALFALFLAGHDVTEVFYWPSGGLSYIPTLAGAAWLFWCLADGLQTPPGLAGASGALLLVAGSSEVGVFLALTTAACVAGWRLLGRGARPWWVLPGVVLALFDLAVVLQGRVGTIEMVGLGGTYVHHAGASLSAAVQAFGWDMLAPESESGSITRIGLSLAARLLALVAARWTVAAATGRPALLPAFAAALLLASFASIAAAFYQFGTLCCQRHDTMRSCFITLAWIAVGAWSAGVRPPGDRRVPAGVAAWTAAVLLLFAPRMPAMLADYGGIPSVIQARAQTWASGLQSGDKMVFTVPPDGRMIGAPVFPVGQFTMSADLLWYDRGVLLFFRKKAMTVRH